MTGAGTPPPALSVAIPTFNNLPPLRQCLNGWRLVSRARRRGALSASGRRPPTPGARR